MRIILCLGSKRPQAFMHRLVHLTFINRHVCGLPWFFFLYYYNCFRFSYCCWIWLWFYYLLLWFIVFFVLFFGFMCFDTNININKITLLPKVVRVMLSMKKIYFMKIKQCLLASRCIHIAGAEGIWEPSTYQDTHWHFRFPPVFEYS